MDMCILPRLRPLPALQLLATSALGLYCAGAMAGGPPDIRPLLEAAPSVDFVYYKPPGMSVMTPPMAGGRNPTPPGPKTPPPPPGPQLEKAPWFPTPPPDTPP